MRIGFVVILFVHLVLISHSQSVDTLVERGITHYNQGEFILALHDFEAGAKRAESEKKSEKLCTAWNNMGNVYARLHDQVNGLRYYQKALATAEKINDKRRIAKITLNIGSLYSDHKDFKNALPYYEDACQKSEAVGDPQLTGDCLNNLAVIYEQLDQNKRASEVYNKALSIYTSLKDTSNIALSLTNLAIVSKKLGNFDDCIRNNKTSMELATAINDRFTVAVNLNNLAYAYIAMGKFPEALSYMQQAYDKSKEIGAGEIIIETYDGWATIYEKQKKYPEALRYRKLLASEKERILNEEKVAQIAEMEVRFQSEKKQNEILVLKQKNEIDELVISEQSLQIQKRNYILGFAGLLILLVTGIIYLRARSLKLRNEIKRQLEIKQGEEKERLRISRDIHDDFGSGLSRINILSEMVLVKTVADPDVTEKVKSISETAKWLVENMKGLIWALNSENTTADQLLARIREYSSDYFENFPIALKSDYPDELPENPLRKETCHALFMTVKEALNNIVKHSKADRVHISVSLSEAYFTIKIRDNGIGFDPVGRKSGNGLRNMKERIEITGGELTLNSLIGKGSEISIRINLLETGNDYSLKKVLVKDTTFSV